MSYTYPLPQLSDYDVSEKTGFLPEELPVTRLPDYYDAWENTVNVLPALLLTKRIRAVVDKFEVLDTTHLKTEPQWRRAYSVLGFLSHAYIWGVDIPTNRLPIQLAKPWVEISAHLRIPPVATYAGLCLWNWQEILPLDGDYENDDAFLDNLRTINTFTGSIDESWFYLVSVYFEYRCAPCIKIGLDAIEFARNNEAEKVTECLRKLAESIDYLGSVLMKMEEMCDPHVFYFKLRPYLAGWKNMANAGLPDGVYYGDEKEPRLLSGGSNAQSSSIQTLDLLLNVDHIATGESSSTGHAHANPFMSEMRSYMPGKHADFLEHLSKVNIIRDYVMKQASENKELVLAYDASVAMLKIFRDKHIRIVTRYIVIQAQKEKSMGSEGVQKSTLRAGLAKSANKDKVLRGTGGTALLPFLKQCRDETGNTAAGSWGRRLLSVKDKDIENAEGKVDGQSGKKSDSSKSFSLASTMTRDSRSQNSW